MVPFEKVLPLLRIRVGLFQFINIQSCLINLCLSWQLAVTSYRFSHFSLACSTATFNKLLKVAFCCVVGIALQGQNEELETVKAAVPCRLPGRI